MKAQYVTQINAGRWAIKTKQGPLVGLSKIDAVLEISLATASEVDHTMHNGYKLLIKHPELSKSQHNCEIICIVVIEQPSPLQ